MSSRLSYTPSREVTGELVRTLRLFAPRHPLDVLVFLVQRLFAVHNRIYKFTKLERLLPHELPRLSPQDASYGGDWGYFWSQGQRLYYRCWLPETELQGILVSIHGAGAHGGHFHVIGEHLAPRGFAYYSPDLPGHGLSEGERGDLHDTEHILAAIAQSVQFAASRHPGRSVYLLGESIGALHALALAARPSRPVSLAGLVLSGPELVPRQTTPAPEGTPFWRQAIKYLRYILCGLLLSRWPVIDMTGREELVTRRPEQAEFSKRDPLRNNQLSVQTMIESYRLIRAAFDLARSVRLPTLILQAEADLVTEPEAAQRLRDTLASADAELVYFEEARHGLYYDPDTPKVLDTLAGWLDRQVGAVERIP